MSRYIIRVHDPFNGMKLYQRLVCQISRLPPLRDACVTIWLWNMVDAVVHADRRQPAASGVVYDRMGIFSGTRRHGSPPTLTLYSGLLSSVLRVSQHLPMQMHLSRRSSFCSSG